MKFFPNYYEWRSSITGPCGLILTRAYCTERIAALNDTSDKSTSAFTETYGKEYLASVIKIIRRELGSQCPSPPNLIETYHEAINVSAGSAGLGIAMALRQEEVENSSSPMT